MPFDLASELPHLLTPAIAWAEAESERAQQSGTPLDVSGLALASHVGVRHPGRIRTLLVDALPLPAEPKLREAALSAGLLGPTSVGLTLGYSIFIVRGSDSQQLLSHECRHAAQYEDYGSIAAFLPAYLQQLVVFGYFNAPLERDARAHEIESP
jgi:hypothetical protein